MTSKKNWVVRLKQLVPNNELDPDDLLDLGVEEGNILEYNVRGKDIEEAKDEFHGSYAIACLDDWDITFIEED